MQVRLGRNYFEPHEEITWNSANVTSGHWVIVGSSGVGKSHFLRRILNDLKDTPGIRIHLFDSHGDLETDPDFTSHRKFSESSDFGLNPFHISPDPDWGGVRKRINAFLTMLNRYGGAAKIGQRQEAVLRTLLYELYEKHGFDANDPSTWHCTKDKRFPTMTDLSEFTHAKLKKLVLGDSDKAIEALDALSRKTPKLQKAVSAKDKDEIEKIKASIIDSFGEYVNAIETGTELESYIHYDSKEVLKSVYNRISNLLSAGIFKDQLPVFSESKPIWRYDIRALSESEQAYLLEIYLENIFFDARQEGIVHADANGGGTIKTIIAIDEAKNFIGEPDTILSVISRQSRKFGIGLILSSQSHKHYNSDTLINAATKILLGIDPLEQSDIARKLAIKETRVKAIQPRHSALIQMRTHSTFLSNTYLSVILDKHQERNGSQGVKETNKLQTYSVRIEGDDYDAIAITQHGDKNFAFLFCEETGVANIQGEKVTKENLASFFNEQFGVEFPGMQCKAIHNEDLPLIKKAYATASIIPRTEQACVR